MAKNPCVRTLMDSQHVKRSKALPKSAQQSFCQIFWELWKKNQLENFYVSSIWNLQTFCEHIDTQWKLFSLNKSECLTQPIQMQLSKIEKYLLCFFLHFRNLQKIFVTLDKKTSLTGYLFLKL